MRDCNGLQTKNKFFEKIHILGVEKMNEFQKTFYLARRRQIKLLVCGGERGALHQIYQKTGNANVSPLRAKK